MVNVPHRKETVGTMFICPESRERTAASSRPTAAWQQCCWKQGASHDDSTEWQVKNHVDYAIGICHPGEQLVDNRWRSMEVDGCVTRERVYISFRNFSKMVFDRFNFS